VALESEALFLQRAVRAKVLAPDKGTAALYVYSQLKQMGAAFTFGDFLIDRGLMSQMALAALEKSTRGDEVVAVSTIGPYELIEMIGEGQNGSVFLAYQKSLDRKVALKILSAEIDPESLERFKAEARVTAKLNHPNVVQGIDVGSDQGLHYFAMELVEGGSVRALIEKFGGQLPELTALKIIQQSAEGLKAAHAAGLVHRDLKPDNILLTIEGDAKLADLGIAQNIRSDGQPAAAEFWASPPYVAPEVIQGKDNDPRSDIYSLGATLFEMLIGQPPFVGETPDEMMNMHLYEAVPDLIAARPGLAPQTAALVRRMLAKNPEDRIQNAATVVEAATRLIVLITAPDPARRAAPVLHVPSPPKVSSPANRAVPVKAKIGGARNLKRPLTATEKKNAARPKFVPPPANKGPAAKGASRFKPR